MQYAEFVGQQLRREQPPIYVPLRLISTSLSWQLAKLGVSPNVCTILGAAVAGLAAYFIAQGDAWSLRVSAALVLTAYLFDCMDGEVARAGGKSTALGAQLDQFSNWFTVVALQIGLAQGAAKFTKDPEFLIWGLYALAGWCTFYYLYLQIARWVSDEADYRALRRLSSVLFWLMPLDENLVIVFALWGRPDLGIRCSAMFGVVLSLAVVALYIIHTIMQERLKLQTPKSPLSDTNAPREH